jgi:hyperosmotically inducible protein
MENTTGRRTMKYTMFLSLVAALVGLSVIAGADPLNDNEFIKSAVEQELTQKGLSNGVGPWVDVEDGTVTLSGKVASVWAKNEALKLALNTDGVLEVRNELEIAAGESDEEVAKDIAEKLRQYAYYTVYDEVSLTVNDGDVILTGRVTMPFKAEEMGKRASKIFGVQSVKNQITTLPMNVGDERLRRVLANRIYNDLFFMEYARFANPPIHIVVERGRVTLSGAVRSEVEKVKAERIARSTFGVFAVENNLKVD